MKRIVALLIVACWSCGAVDQPERLRIAGAFEVPLPTAADKEAFLDILRSEAGRSGYHVD